ncbi:MAG: SMC family ATPase, partial [Chloroflexi bacterium]|nr:SMC family ATPase [Chloroflexota bacterium]
MVPLRLSLRNFLCYRGQSELDLTGLRLACLCGDNGNGKSALLDAITWALWGRARGADDELIHMAESETEVDLEFLAGDQRYRVVRRRSRSRRSGVPGQTELVLFQVTAKGLVPLTGDSVRQTEQRVSQLLGLDYSTFINSAFLVQGRADEFTVKPPSQRKQVLADILGLGYYDQAVVRARELAREQEGKRQAVEADLARIEAGLAYLPRYQAEVEAQEAGSEQARARLEVAEARLRELEAAHHRMESLQEQHQEAAQSQGQAAERLAHWQGELAQRQRGLQEHQGLLAQASSIREGYVRWQQAVAEEEALAARLAQALALGQERAALEQAVAAARDKLEGQRREIEGQVALWKPQAQALPGFERQREEVLAWLKALAQEETRQGEQAKLLEAALERQQDLHLHLKQLAAEAQELGEKAKLLAEGGARCPLCGSELALQERERLQAQLSTQGQEKVKERQGLE